MIHKQALQFLQQLSKNNSKSWFDDHRDQYVDAKEDFIQFATILLQELSKMDTSLAELNAEQVNFDLVNTGVQQPGPTLLSDPQPESLLNYIQQLGAADVTQTSKNDLGRRLMLYQSGCFLYGYCPVNFPVSV